MSNTSSGGLLLLIVMIIVIPLCLFFHSKQKPEFISKVKHNLQGLGMTEINVTYGTWICCDGENDEHSAEWNAIGNNGQRMTSCACGSIYSVQITYN